LAGGDWKEGEPPSLSLGREEEMKGVSKTFFSVNQLLRRKVITNVQHSIIDPPSWKIIMKDREFILIGGM
jgi:hypothetical protein